MKRGVSVAMLAVLIAGCSGSSGGSNDQPETTIRDMQTTTTFDVVENIRSATQYHCAMDPDNIYAEAGTTDPQAAAEYVAEVTVEQYRDVAVAACLEGLTTGNPG